MANAVYPKAKEAALIGQLNLQGTVKVALIDTGTYSYSADHEFFSQVSGVVGTPQIISLKSYTNGVFGSFATVTFPLTTGTTAEALIVYLDSGTATTSRLVAYLDTGVTGLPITPNGNDIILSFEQSTGRIFSL